MFHRRQKTIPLDVIYLVLRYLPQEELGPLVGLSKSLYQICSPLLYRAIHLHEPKQLAKLSRGGANVDGLLKHTHYMYIDDRVLCTTSWNSNLVSAHPIEPLVNVWQATTSLRWLQICQSDKVPPPSGVMNRFGGHEPSPYSEALSLLATNPAFLPKLAFGIIIDPKPHSPSSGSNWWWWWVEYFEGLFSYRQVQCFTHLTSAKMQLAIGRHETPKGLPSSSHWDSLSSDIENVFDALEAGPWSLLLDVTLRTRIGPSNLGDFGSLLLDLVVNSSNVAPNLKVLSVHLNTTVTADQLFDFTKQLKAELFDLASSVAPILETIILSLPTQEKVQWWKIPECYRGSAYQNLTWVPSLSHPYLRQKALAWWVNQLTKMGGGILGEPNVKTINSLATELHRLTRFGQDLNEVSREMIVSGLLVYYGKRPLA